jgi:ADP-ribosylation factor-binding protein GGA
MLIVQAVNHRNPHVSLLALGLLDTLVQMCGYPFHLQISTKEFLNELVRRFPERPPPFPGPVMSRILEIIHGWKEGICVESRWRDDLGNIRDMHRLLTFKGYRFRDIPRTAPSAPPTSVRSPPSTEITYAYCSLRPSSRRRNSKTRIVKRSLLNSKSSFGEGRRATSPLRRSL